jgi:predicted transcriptional regulator
MAVASLRDLAAVILVKGFSPEPETIRHSNEEEIPVLGTDLSTFEVAGRIFQMLSKQS